MRKKSKIVIVLAISILILGITVGYLYFKHSEEREKEEREREEYKAWHQYSRRIIRDTNNETEENLLAIAENLNYSQIFNMEPLNSSSYGGSFFINKTVIDFYWTRIGLFEEKELRGIYQLNYTADVIYAENIRFELYKQPGYDIQMCLLESNLGEISIDHPLDKHIQIAIKNNSDYVVINGSDTEFISLDRIFNNCYIIKMHLSDSGLVSELTGYKYTYVQYVVLDSEGDPLLIYCERWDSIS